MRTRRLSSLIAACGLLLALAGCTAEDSTGSTGTVTLPSPSGTSAAMPGTTTVDTTATTTPPAADANGLLTGPGVTDTAITAAVLLGADPDDGFTDGIALFQKSANQSGGICGRTLEFTVENSAGVDQAQAYRQRSTSVLGFLIPDATEFTAADLAAADQIPVLAVSGSSAQLSAFGPLVLGATDDIKAINALAYLVAKGKVPEHGTVGLLTDGSTASANAQAGARWFADRTGLTLDVRQADTGGDWGGAAAVLALTDAAGVNQLLSSTPANLLVVTTLHGYDPATMPAAAKDRLLLTVSTPAFGSDHPTAAAVSTAFSKAFQTKPGPRVLAGYALASGWGRLLTRACADRSLTRPGIHAAMSAVGPAGVDSLFGPSDPASVVDRQLPATRVSSMALADPGAPAGLRPLVWTQTATDINEYVPAR